MYENKQNYKWELLEQQVRQRLNGQYDEAFEQALQNDAFLQAVVIGLEEQLRAQPASSVADLVADKKHRIWKNLIPAPNPLVQFVQHLKYTWEELQYAQCQYLFGFNGGFVILILAFGLWINLFPSPEEVATFVQVEVQDGFKQ